MESTPTMTRSALSSTGYVSQWLWKYVELGVRRTFSRLATRLSVKSSVPKPEALSSIYQIEHGGGVRANAKALLMRVMLTLVIMFDE